MLRTQETLAIQTDVLPTQNIGHLDQNQPQIFSLLSGSNNSTSIRKPRRKKNTKLEEAIPVMINPQITRTPTGVTFGAPLNHSVTLPESLSPIVSTRLINSQTIPLRFYIEHDSYDANNNINHNQNQSLPIPLTTSVSVQTQRTSTWPNEFISDANSNSLPQLITESQFLKLNQLLNSRIDEAASAICATKQNEHKHIIPSSLSIMTTAKPTRKRSKRQDCNIPTEQSYSVQQISPFQPNITQYNISNGLPSIIPTSVTATPINSEESPLSVNAISPPTTTTTGNFIASPNNINNEYSFIPTQKKVLPSTSTNIPDLNSIAKQYFHEKAFSHLQNTITNSCTSTLPYNLHQLLAGTGQQYCILPADLIPTNIISVTSTTPPVLIPSDIKNDEINKKSIQTSKDKQSVSFKSSKTAVSIIKKMDGKNQKQKKPSKKDIRTKKQLQRLARRNQLAIMKFMMRKRKQQRQERKSVAKVPEVTKDQVVSKLADRPLENMNKVEPNLPDIITPSLKISFDATQNIESISLYYHRRRKPEISNRSPSSSLTNSDNKLSLLIEAVELIETLRGNSKSATSSDT